MTILITGVCGFIGSNLAKYFLNKNIQIIGVDNLSRGSIHNINSFSSDKNFTLINVNICNYELFYNKVKEEHFRNNIREVWHFAANSDIPAGIENSDIDLQDTYMTTLNTLTFPKLP